MSPDPTETTAGAPVRSGGDHARRKALTIGAVTKILSREFGDVSISKIRYLEDQKLLSPRRTPGGYRLYSQSDVERLRKILQLQRDEFLPLRVIRQELAAGSDRDDNRSRSAGQRRAVSVDSAGGASRLTLQQLVEQTGASPELISELAEYRIIQPENVDGSSIFDDSDREIVQAAADMARHGISGRHLKVFRTSADREAGLLEQVLSPQLQSQSTSSRRDALETLETLVAACGNLKHLLLVRDLRRLTGD
jgi:DNA-binding transcriptional MerR regulator